MRRNHSLIVCMAHNLGGFAMPKIDKWSETHLKFSFRFDIVFVFLFAGVKILGCLARSMASWDNRFVAFFTK